MSMFCLRAHTLAAHSPLSTMDNVTSALVLLHKMRWMYVFTVEACVLF